MVVCKPIYKKWWPRTFRVYSVFFFNHYIPTAWLDFLTMRLQQIGRIPKPNIFLLNFHPNTPAAHHFTRAAKNHILQNRSVGLLAATAGVFASFAPLQVQGLLTQGSLDYLFFWDQTMQIYGKFDGIPL